VSQQVERVDTVFLHEDGEEFRVVASRDGDRVFQGRLEVTEREAGPRPARLRVTDGTSEQLYSPDEFVDLARGAARIRVSEQTSRAGRATLRELLDAYQLEAKVVRTCRYCANSGRYAPITAETAINADGEDICPDCARAELDRELAYRGEITGSARERLEELLVNVQDLDRITDLLSGELDPDLTKFDEISATVDDVDPVPTSDLSLHPGIQSKLEGRFDTLLPVQSLAMENGAPEEYAERMVERIFEDEEYESVNSGARIEATVKETVMEYALEELGPDEEAPAQGEAVMDEIEWGRFEETMDEVFRVDEEDTLHGRARTDYIQ